MTCDDALPLINALVDREIDDEGRVALESHLVQCPHCRSLVETQRALDADLLRAFRPARETASRVAERVVSGLTQGPQQGAVSPPRRRFGGFAVFLGLLGSMAAGFALALLVLPRSQPEQPVVGKGSVPSEPVPAAARLVAATGPVEFRRGPQAAWRKAVEAEAVEAGTSVRTGDASVCEIETAPGSKLRLNQRTELAVRTARDVELQLGQLWCQSPPNVSLHVVSKASTGTAAPWSCTVPGKSTALTSADPQGESQIIAASGGLEVSLDSERRRIEPGQLVRVSGGKLEVADARDNVVMSTAWMLPLLARQGPESPEVSSRVDLLLAQLGHTKVSYLYEEQIRGLGESGILPLLKFVESPDSRADPAQRETALRILSDTAPAWAVPELIALLADENADARVLAATALKRLTGTTQQQDPQTWGMPGPGHLEAYAHWQEWWIANRTRIARPVAFTREFPKPQWPAPSRTRLPTKG